MHLNAIKLTSMTRDQFDKITKALHPQLKINRYHDRQNIYVDGVYFKGKYLGSVAKGVVPPFRIKGYGTKNADGSITAYRSAYGWFKKFRTLGLIKEHELNPFIHGKVDYFIAKNLTKTDL